MVSVIFCLASLLVSDTGVLIADFGGPAQFATKLHKSPESWNATGELKFLNDWCVLLL
jgi:hypothetical protein